MTPRENLSLLVSGSPLDGFRSRWMLEDPRDSRQPFSGALSKRRARRIQPNTSISISEPPHCPGASGGGPVALEPRSA